ncbi:FkbM family methyltransferase [uncultured Ruegeria sp.]|uniref:FkbM family methyltransferase n=1 Tax=uncultured Ruegeria sp. TaxID=259304 RepID=UPI002617E69F|nr:FkbM family methyltransferase [uncultured Ruegeria sp.]
MQEQTLTSQTSTSLGRSFDVYYRDAKRTKSMDRLNAMFLSEGGLAFDIGAHVGDRTGSFRRLGASVVSLEPQPQVFRALRLIYGRDDNITLRCEAVGARPGSVDLFLNTANPTISTASSALISAAQGSPRWVGQNWDGQIQVPMTTLDRLVDHYGLPDFVKIDVEGFECDVLMGLTCAVPALSFEFTTIQPEVTRCCLIRLKQLGDYEFNYSLGEDHALHHSCWIDADSLGQELTALPHLANSGDVFARLR